MTERQENVKAIIIAGLIITAVTWTADVIGHVFIDNQGDLMTSLFRPGLNESAKRLALIIILFGIIGYFMELTKNRREMIREYRNLKEAFNREVQDTGSLKKFKSLLPTCPTCDSIRDEFNSWHELDKYLAKYPEAVYAEGYCPGCTRKINIKREAGLLSTKGFIGQA